MQRPLWASQQRSPDGAHQNMPLLVHLYGTIDPQRFVDAFDTVVNSSDVLRSQLPDATSGEVWIASKPPTTTAVLEMPREEATAWALERGRRRLDARTCCYDSVLLMHPDDTSSWFLNQHHLITDATACRLVIEATAQAYEGNPVEPSNYYEWAETIDGESAEGRAPNNTMVGALYRDRSTPTVDATRLRVSVTDLLPAMEARVESDYRLISENLSWATLIVASTASYLHRLTGTEHVRVGLLVHHRGSVATRSLIGPLIELMPVDIDIPAGATNRDLHAVTQAAMLQTLKATRPGASPGSQFDVVVNATLDSAVSAFGSIPASTQWLATGAIDADNALRVHLSRFASSTEAPRQFAVEEALSLELDVNHGVANEEHHDHIPDHFHNALEALVSRPDEPLAASSLCTADELQVLDEWGTAERLVTPTPLNEQLKTALNGSDKIVLRQDDTALTGHQLWNWACAIATDLRTAGIGPGSRVGIELAPSIEAVAAIYGTVLAGASFVPSDPHHPASRRAKLRDRAELQRNFNSADAVRSLRPAGDVAEPAVHHQADDEAYLLFTSGSTGEPKGVPISKRGLVGYLRFAVDTYFDAGAPVAPLFGSLTFDLTITSVFGPVLAGGELRTFADAGPGALTLIAGAPDITWCKATPSHLEILVRLLPEHHRLNTLVVGGEAFATPLARALFSFNPTMHIFNEYGPTEAVVGCMIHRTSSAEADERSDVPIGRPSPGTRLLVVDEHGVRLPIGATGELWIAHDGITTGYLAGPETEAEADPADKFAMVDGVRYYRSGDLVQLECDNDHPVLVYRGRIDAQVKVGGMRLEPTEVEAALTRHPLIDRAAVRMWAPSYTEPRHHCIRCGLPDNVPGVAFDEAGVCDTCHDFDRIAPLASSWFKTEADLSVVLADNASTGSGAYDCVHLLSGGKDSTYALHRLVDLGFRPYVVTLDNGYISEGAMANIERSVKALGLDHEYLRSPQMNAIFADSLATFSNVCNGCYKALYVLAINRARELDIPTVVTGLSRGQLFETRLVPQQFAADRFDPGAIDRAVLQARKQYHRAVDLPNRVLDTDVFTDDALFDELQFVDFYRYVDVELSEVLDYLTTKTPWVRPADTGRSTNCLINVAGIHTHLEEQGYHNYAVPYAWDVRLGHKQRDEAIAELEDEIQPGEVDGILHDVGYTPTPRSVLTAWIQLGSDRDREPSPAELRAFLSGVVPRHALPTAFVTVNALPITANGKLDDAALPNPERVHRSGAMLPVAPVTEVQSQIVAQWEQALGIEPIGIDDDFFALGGTSLDALSMIVALSDVMGIYIREESAFVNTTPRALASAIESQGAAGGANAGVDGPGERPISPLSPLDEFATANDVAPALSAGEQALLVDQRSRPDALMYNVARIFHVDGPVDAARFETALRAVAAQHEPLSWTYSQPRRHLDSDRAIEFDTDPPIAGGALDDRLDRLQRAPFDIANGPLLRCLVQPLDDATTVVAFVIHHVSGDHESFDRLWDQICAFLDTGQVVELGTSYGAFCQWQEQTRSAQQQFWLENPDARPPSRIMLRSSNRSAASVRAEPDGFLSLTADVSADEIRRAADPSPVAVAMAAAAIALAPYVEGDYVDLGLLASTRTHPAASSLFGYLLNPIPIRIDVTPDDVVSSLTRAAFEAVGRALPHRDYPTTAIIADRRRENRPAPATNVLVAYDDAIPTSLDGHQVRQGVHFNGAAVTDLSFFVEVRDDGVELGLEYAGSAIGRDAAQDLLARFGASITAAVRTRQASVATIDEAVGASLIIGPELTSRELITDRIAEHLRHRGAADAVTCGAHTLSWRELDRRSRVLAKYLIDHGVGPSDRVAVMLPRSTSIAPAILACHMVGAVYVPVDPSYPQHRIDMMMSGTDCKVVIAAPDHQEHGTRTTIAIDGHGIDGAGWHALPEHPAAFAAAAEDFAYIIHTSGSTGVPNPVAVTIEQLSASTNGRRQVYDTAPSKFLMVSGLAFDSSIVGIYWTLASGGTLVLPTEQQAHDVDGLVTLITDRSPSHLLCVPTMYNALLDRRPTGVSGWVSSAIVAGEQCPPSLVSKHFDRVPSCTLTNEYGPTETTVWATAQHLTSAIDVPIGTPCPGGWIAVLDPHDAIVPEGVEGELVVGGTGVTGGYLNDPDTTSARFDRCNDVPALAHLPGRFFRTGDRASIANDVAYFHGRVDEQLNIGGARIEPAEIENTLTTLPGVRAAIVVARDTRTLDELIAAVEPAIVARAMQASSSTSDPAGALRVALAAEVPGRPELVAHLESDSTIDRRRLDKLVSQALPAASRPTNYGFHRELPRTPNGKLDRDAAGMLPVAEDAPARTANVATDATRTVDDVTAIFAGLLRNRSFGANDDFFDGGGHSLLAIELVLGIEEAFGIELPTSAIYEARTPTEFHDRFLHGARAASRAQPKQAARSTSLVIPIQPHGDRTPLYGLHNLGDDCEHLRPLGRELSEDQPLIGVGPGHVISRWSDRRIDPTAPVTVDEVAAQYADELERLTPEGPMNLIGICGGGVVAFSVARMLAERGREVPLLTIVTDWHAPGLEAGQRPPDFKTKLRLRIFQARQQRMRYLRRLARYPRDVLMLRIDRRLVPLYRKLGRPLPRRLQIREHIDRGIDDLFGYEYRPYDGRTLIVRGMDDPAFHVERDHSWQGVLTDYSIETVTGHGLWVVQPPHVTDLAQVLEREMELASRSDASLDVEHVGSLFCDALGRGELWAALDRLSRSARLSARAIALVERLENTTQAIAAAAATTAETTATALATAGVAANAAPLPPRMALNMSIVFVDRPPVQLVNEMAAVGFRPQNDLVDPAATTTVFHRVDGQTADRVQLTMRAATADEADVSGGYVEDASLGGFLGTPSSLIAPLLEFAELTDKEILVDIGCGDGRVLIEAATVVGCRALGIEHDADLVAEARRNISLSSVESGVEIELGDGVDADVTDADVVFVFLPPEGAVRMVEQLLPIMAPTARLIAHEQLTVDWPIEPDRRSLVCSPEGSAEPGLTVAHLWFGRGSG